MSPAAGVHLRRALRAMAFCSLLGACAGPRNSPAPVSSPDAGSAPDGLPPVQVRTATYELYAPSDAIAHAVRQELDHASLTFQRYFGAAPPPIGVVVFNSAEEMKTFDWAPIRLRVRGVLPWLVQLEANPVSPSAIEGQRAIAHEACPPLPHRPHQRGARPRRPLAGGYAAGVWRPSPSRLVRRGGGDAVRTPRDQRHQGRHDSIGGRLGDSLCGALPNGAPRVAATPGDGGCTTCGRGHERHQTPWRRSPARAARLTGHRPAARLLPRDEFRPRVHG